MPVQKSFALIKNSMSTIRIDVNDDCFERARKIIESAGVARSDFLTLHIAEGIEKYRKLDRSFVESEEINDMISAMTVASVCLNNLEKYVSEDGKTFLDFAKDQLKPYLEE